MINSKKRAETGMGNDSYQYSLFGGRNGNILAQLRRILNMEWRYEPS